MPSLSRIRVAVSALVLLGLLFLGARGMGPLPALGPLLDPLVGVWSVAQGAELPETQRVELSGLEADVEVLYDDRGVPHIFASTAEDAARALGWVSARDRLFEMELRWRTTAGRLSELVGSEALAFDRSMRRLGLAWSADREFAGTDPETPEMQELVAYAEGVNAWIDGLEPRDLPLEYRILEARPAAWRPVYSVYFLKLMGWNLAYSSSMDLEHAEAAGLVGREAADALFPVHSPIQEPVQPLGRGGSDERSEEARRAEPGGRGGQDGQAGELDRAGQEGGAGRRFDEVELPPPGSPDSVARAAGEAARAVERALAALPQRRSGGEPLVGSNNWAVAPERTAGGNALLAGDPHLELTLPSIWYEAHLVVPGELDVYGVNMPSVPRIVIGFNRDVAWSFTNTGADVLDYHAEQVDDPVDPARYRVAGEWRPLERRIEEYRSPGGNVLAVDTLHVTHRGPVMEEDGRFLSMRWTVHGGSGGEDRALRRIMAAGSVEAWMEAMESYGAPAQTGIVADGSGTIAIRATGHFPIHADGDGRDVEDGSVATDEWAGFWPVEAYPQAQAPAQGYLASANQEPLAPEAYPSWDGEATDTDADPGSPDAGDGDGAEGDGGSATGALADEGPRPSGSYLGASWTSPWRALRINELLRADSAVTAGAMRRYQMDPGSPRADLFVPAFLAAAEGASDPAGEAADLLAEWDRRYTLDNERAVLFEYAMEALTDRTWDELERPEASAGGPAAEATPGAAEGDTVTDSDGPARVATPSETILAVLLDRPDSPWWDRGDTPDEVEDRDAILRESVAEGYRMAVERHGPPNEGGWRWRDAWSMDIRHLLSLPSLSALGVPVRGGDGTLNPLYDARGTSGASWRMVVEMGPEVGAWTIYPGGQSGNPVSPWYDDRIDAWSAGELEPALFPRSPSELDPDRVAASLELVAAP